MAEATTFTSMPSDRAGKRAQIRAWLEEMDRLHHENIESQKRIDRMDKEIDRGWQVSTLSSRASLFLDV